MTTGIAVWCGSAFLLCQPVSTLEVEAEEPGVQGQLELHFKFEVNLGYREILSENKTKQLNKSIKI